MDSIEAFFQAYSRDGHWLPMEAGREGEGKRSNRYQNVAAEHLGGRKFARLRSTSHDTLIRRKPLFIYDTENKRDSCFPC
jgi:hypothetical protein